MPLTESNANVPTPPSSSSSRHDSMKTKKVTPSKRHDFPMDRNPSSPTTKRREIALRNDGSPVVEKLKNSLTLDAKENDLAVEINITTGSNVQVNSIFSFVSRKEMNHRQP